MKKNLLYGFLFALVAAGCYQEELSVTPQTDCEGRTYTTSFEDNETRTYVEDGVLLRWTAGDQISLFDGNTLNRQYKFDGETGDNSGTFSIVDAPYGSGNDVTANYAVYPYSSDVKITEGGAVTVTLPSEQSYAEDSFGLGANTMVAVTKDTDDTFLRFRNTCGYLKLQLYGEDVTVRSVTLTGNGDERLAGKATVATSYGQEPVVSMSDEAGATVVLDCGEGVEIGSTAETATAFWIVVPPVTFEDGFTVTVEDTDGGTFVKSTSNEIRISRNVIKPMKAFEVEIEKTIPDNQIWYTSSDGKVVDPYIDQYFGAKIKSNIYKDGKGIITFDGDVTSIGSNAFRYCSSLTGVTIPGSVTTIATYAFYECSALVDVIIPGSVTKINDFAFAKCSSLKNIFIPYGVRVISGDAFAQCSSLTDISIPESVKSIGNYAFYVCSSLTEIIIPDSVTSIGSNAFAHCESLTSLTIPGSVSNIGTEVILGCISLASVVVEPDNKVYDSRNDCNAIIETASNTLIGGCKSTVIPDGVVEIADDSFRNCETLPYINIPASVTGIGDRAFSNCPSLARMDVKATTPPALGEYAISGTHDDLIIYVPENSVNLYKNAPGWKALNIMAEPVLRNNQIWYTSKDGEVLDPAYPDRFGVNMLSNTYENGIGIMTFDGELTAVGEGACRNKSFTSITLPESVTSIGDYAFEICQSLTDINMPEAVTEIGYRAFQLCVDIVELIMPEGLTDISSYAFYGCSGLQRMILPSTVTYIGDRAFSGCTGELIVNCDIPDYSKRSEEGVFYDSRFTRVTIGNSVTEIGEWAFEECEELTSVSFGENIASIGHGAFYGCSGITSLEIPDSVTDLGGSAFCECTGLASVTIGDNIRVIGSSVFYGCTGLKEVTIGEGVASVGNNAFNGCSALTDITIPENVTRINEGAFGGCVNLTTMICMATVPPMLASTAFYNCNKDMTIYVPAASLDAYKAAENWRNLNVVTMVE